MRKLASRVGAILLFSACHIYVSSEEVHRGLSCAQHPGYRPELLGPIVQSWRFSSVTRNLTRFPRSMYLPRLPRFAYKFEGSLQSVLSGLDIFFTVFDNSVTDKYVSLHLQRSAVIYILVPTWAEVEETPSLDGWTGVGLARLKLNRLQFGVHKRRAIELPSRAFVFRKQIDASIQKLPEINLPSSQWIQEHMHMLQTTGNYITFLAEADGSSSKAPLGPNGETISPGESCPKWLHDLWMTQENDENDEHTKRKVWHTWHPLWDPCYWCSYDHEHGSSAQQLMGYTPKFGYTAWKNGQQDETHEGFKGYVLRSEDYFVYINIHSHISMARRYEATFHTVVAAITHAETKELLLELSVKANFGKPFARLKDGGLMPLLGAVEDDADTMCLPKRGRIINVLDPENIDPRLKYNDDNLLAGEYEQWRTDLPCTFTTRYNELLLEIKTPATGMRSTDTTEQTHLGDMEDGEFQRFSSLRRAIFLKKMRIGEQECKFALSDIHGTPKDGIFYTDKVGRRIFDGPGPSAIRQYVKPGFNAVIDGGEFEPEDTWLGMYKANHMGSFRNIGYGVDPDIN